MPGRHAVEGKAYRYGFQGQEKDDEIKGEGNSYATSFRQYDPRIARWLTIDPLANIFAWQSPYVAYDNNPLNIVDPHGLSGENPKIKFNTRIKRDIVTKEAEQVLTDLAKKLA